MNYLSVDFAKATDRGLIEHLATRLRLYIDVKLRLSDAVRALRPRCDQQREELARQSADLEVQLATARLQHEKQLAATVAEHRATVDAVTKQCSVRLEELQAKLTAEVGGGGAWRADDNCCKT